jgi:hypothetical protein
VAIEWNPPHVAPIVYSGATTMASIMVFALAFCVGCLTGVVVDIRSKFRSAEESSSAPLNWVLSADE